MIMQGVEVTYTYSDFVHSDSSYVTKGGIDASERLGRLTCR